MNTNKLFKKITAVATGATMLGATMMGALAADLNEYPDIVSAGGPIAHSSKTDIGRSIALRLAKEDTRIDYVGDWTSFNYRKAMQDAGYKNGDKLDGTMFPQLWPKNI